MALVANFVLETANAPGSAATFNLAGPPAGRRGFASAFATGSTVYYFMDDGTQAEWGSGLLTTGSPNTLQRVTVIGNTAGTTSRLNFTGIVRVYNEIPAEKAATVDSIPLQVTFNYLVAAGGFPGLIIPLPSGYNWYRMEFNAAGDATVSTTGNIYLRFSTDGGSTFSGNNNYSMLNNGSLAQVNGAAYIPVTGTGDAALLGTVDIVSSGALTCNTMTTLTGNVQHRVGSGIPIISGTPNAVAVNASGGGLTGGSRVRLSAGV